MTLPRTLLAAGLLALASLSYAAEPVAPIDAMITRADALRSRDAATFDSLLTALDARRGEFTARQGEQVQLLNAYRDVVRGRHEEAIRSAIELFERSHDVALKYRAALLVANAAGIMRDFTLSLRYLDRALALETGIADRDQRQMGYVVAAIVYNQHAKFQLGRQYAELVLAQTPAARIECVARQLRIEARAGLDLPLDEERDVTPAITFCEAQGELIPANLIRTHLARRWAAEGKRDQAIALLTSHLADVEATRYPLLIGEFHGLLADYRLAAGDRTGAEVDARQAIAAGGNNVFAKPLVTAHRVLYEVASARGDFQTALSEYQAFAEADKARLDDIMARELAFQISRTELQQKNQSIALLSKQNEVLRLQQQVAHTASQNTRLVIALLALLLAGGALWAVRARRAHVSLRRLADTDGLTGISNRRHFRTQAEAAFALCAARGQPVAVLLFDLDHFKHINDRYGHAAGDWVLGEVARCCMPRCRKGDLFGRMGGEEFALALLDCDLNSALAIAESLRHCIESINPERIGQAFGVTASFGIAGSSQSGHGYETLCAHADVAMYRAKDAGRNRISVYDGRAEPAVAAALAGASAAVA